MNYTILKPCSENWDKMKPVEGGRFCDHCSKKVFDLTNGQAVPETIEEPCIHMEMIIPKKISGRKLLAGKNPFLYLHLFFLLLISSRVKAQIAKLQAKDVNFTGNKIDSTTTWLVLSGNVIDSTTQEALPFVEGWVHDRGRNHIGNFTTDLDGRFVFRFLQRGGFDTLVNLQLNYVGYQPVEIENIPLYKKDTCIKITMKDLSCTNIGTFSVAGGGSASSNIFVDGQMVTGVSVLQEPDLLEQITDSGSRIVLDTEGQVEKNKGTNGLKTRLDNLTNKR